MFINYAVISSIIPDARTYLIPILILAIILDLDHIPGYLKLLFMPKAEKSKLGIKEYVTYFRTAIQEPIGILTIEALLLILYIYGVRSMYLLISSLSIFLHWIIDFLTVHTRPFEPIDNRIICLFFKTKQSRIISEIAITLLAAVIFLISII
jgi:hypothetical protein